MQVKIAELEQSLLKLNTSDREFAGSLIAAFKEWGGLTVKQAPWVQKLIDRANAVPASIPVTEVGVSFAGVVNLFLLAKTKLKFPKIKLALTDGSPISLSLVGKAGKYPGSINISDGGPYGDNQYYGRVLADGQWMVSATTTSKGAEFHANLLTLLQQLAEKPAETAAAYGKLTGNCCFCNSALTDPKSTNVGYGPVCAKHYGLPHGTSKQEAYSNADTQLIKKIFSAKSEVLDVPELVDSLTTLGFTVMTEVPEPPMEEYPGEVTDPYDSDTNKMMAAHYQKERPSRKVKFDLVPGQAVKNLMEALDAQEG